MKAPTIRKQRDEAIIARDNFREETIDLKRAKNKLVEDKASLERTVSNQAQEITNHEKNLEDIQRDMRTVCEAVYGDDFRPEWTGDRPMNIWQNGQEYTLADPSSGRALIDPPTTYVEPIQRLIRMIWRRTHWGLNPLILRDYGQTPR